MYDPFGYYKDKNIYAIKRNEHLPFYEDFPVNDSQWFIGENWAQVDTQPMNYLEDPDYLEKLSKLEDSNSDDLPDDEQFLADHKKSIEQRRKIEL